MSEICIQTMIVYIIRTKIFLIGLRSKDEKLARKAAPETYPLVLVIVPVRTEENLSIIAYIRT